MTNVRLFLILVVFSCLLIPSPVFAQQDVGLCPYTDAAGRPLLPRYEAHNRRLVLVDWTTGADFLTLGGDLAQTWTLGWSADCRYLATAVGTSDSMDTVVWDTVTAERMGSVPDAHGQAHPITWGPGNLLVVETRGGGVLWNVPTGSQINLNAAFHTTRVRNFSRLRWDTENNHLIADLAVGGRKIYDLATGQEVALSPAAQYNPDLIVPTPERAVLVGGKLYDCRDFYWQYVGRDQQIILRVRGVRYPPRDVLAVVDAGVSALSIRVTHAPNCRYARVVLVKPEDRYETVIYDLSELRRVASFGDAYVVPHPFEWASDNRHAFIASKEGVFFWDVLTDTRTLLTDRIVTSLDGPTQLGGWQLVKWDTATNQIYMILSADESAVTRFEGATGTLVARYELPGYRSDLYFGMSFELIDGGRTLRMHQLYGRNPMMTLVDLASGEAQTVPYEPEPISSPRYTDFGSTEVVAPAAPIDAVSGRQPYRYVGVSQGLPYSWRVRRTVDLLETPYDTGPFYDGGTDRRDQTVIIFDSKTEETMVELESPYAYRTYVDVMWSPDGTWAVVQTTKGYFVVDIANRSAVLLKASRELYKPYSPYWDFARGQIIVNSVIGAAAFDLRTGEQRKILSMGEGDARDVCGCYINSISADGRTLWTSGYGRIGLIDLDTLNGVFVDFDRYNNLGGKQYAISPDGRYIVVARYVANVWDLSDLAPEIDDRDPVHRWNLYVRARGVRFIDNTTVEIKTADGGTFTLNVETGETEGR